MLTSNVLAFPSEKNCTNRPLSGRSATDTLLYAGELAIDTDLWKLTQQTIELNDVELSDFHGSLALTT